MTRLGLCGVPGLPYGDFGKEQNPHVPRDLGNITQLIGGIPRQRYGTFERATSGGGNSDFWGNVRFHKIRKPEQRESDDDQIAAILALVLAE